MEAEKSNSKSQAWFCTTGLPSDVVIDVDDMTFHLHKFPLMSKSEYLNDLISKKESIENSADAESEIEVNSFHISLPEFPGGSDSFEAAAKFCYGVKIDLSAANAASLRCAGEVLQMTEEYSEDNLISHTERFFSHSVFRNLKDSITALKSCEILMPMAEGLGIVNRCINTISAKAALVDPSLFGWPVNDSGNRKPRSKPRGAEPWFEQLSVLCYDFFNRVLDAMKALEISNDVLESCLLHYASKCFPGISRSGRRQSNSTSNASEADQRELLESIVSNLPAGKCSISSRETRILFGLLRTANILSASEHCKCALERKLGAQLEQATLDDLLIPSYSYLNETLYDVDCVERILGHFLDCLDSKSGERLTDNLDSSSPSIMLVGKLIDGYLSEIASDSNLKAEKLCNLVMSLPVEARLFDDGLYRAVDVYLKAHPWMTESERETICRVMDWQKLTLEACTHAAQNERLPVRAVVQVLFFEQLQLRQAIAGNLVGGSPSVNDHRGGDEDPGSSSTLRENQVLSLDMDTMKNRVNELERECSTMKKVIQKMDKDVTSKSSFTKMFGCKFKTQVCDSHQPKTGRTATSKSRHHNR